MSAVSRVAEAIRILDPYMKRMRFVGPASAANIAESERMLLARFPPSYRSFVEQLGAGSVLGREIYGVVSDPSASGPPNVVSATLNARKSLALPERFVVVVDLDDSSAIALDVGSADSDGETPVVRIWPGEEADGLVEGEVAPDFGSFFVQFVRDRLQLV